MKITGKILWYCNRDGYGQIIGDDGNRYFVDSSVLNFEPEVFKNEAVEFELNPNIKTPLCSMNVSKQRNAK